MNKSEKNFDFKKLFQEGFKQIYHATFDIIVETNAIYDFRSKIPISIYSICLRGDVFFPIHSSNHLER